MNMDTISARQVLLFFITTCALSCVCFTSVSFPRTTWQSGALLPRQKSFHSSDPVLR